MDFGKISKQGYSCLKIPNKILAGINAAKFNGAIVEYKDQILLAYRCYSEIHGRSCIALTKFNRESFIDAVISGNPNKLKVEFNTEMNLYAKCRNNSILEDPRFTIHHNSLYISYVELLSGSGWHPAIRCCKLKEDFSVEHVIPLKIGGNETGVEKNWLFFSHKEKLHIIYDIHHHHCFQINDRTGRIEKTYYNDKMHWVWGWMRGGTTPIRINNKEYLSFLHSSDYKAWQGRRYSMTPYCFNANEPFEITRIWNEPIVFGSGEEYFCGGGNGQCIFPMGVIKHERELWVSVGINDSFSAVIRFDRKNILDRMEPAKNFHNPKWFHFYTDKTALTAPAPSHHWIVLKSGGSSGTKGIFHTNNPKIVTELIYNQSIKRITEEKFHELYNKHLVKRRK